MIPGLLLGGIEDEEDAEVEIAVVVNDNPALADNPSSPASPNIVSEVIP